MVAELKRGATPYVHGDPELGGHAVRVQPNGPPHAFYVICRDHYGKQRWVKLGSTAEMTVAESRDKAREVMKRLKAGQPAFEPPAPVKDTVGDVMANWFRRHVEAKRVRTVAEMRRLVDRHVLPHWGDRAFADIKRSDIARLLDHIEDTSGAFTADAVLTILGSAANWLSSRDDDYISPFATKHMRRVPSHKRRRERP